jgi:dipicolinate synthase subunit A
MTGKKIAVVGGDLRNKYLAALLAGDGNEVNLYGFDQIDQISPCLSLKDDLKTTIAMSEIVVCPIPFTNDGERVNSPLFSEPIYINELVEYVMGGKVLFGGAFSEKVKELFESKGIKYIDFLKQEELAVLNAIPTAEGAIQVAMENTPFTLHDSKVLVVGFGRIGKILSKMLRGLCAKVTVSARKPDIISWIDALGYNAVYTSQIKDVADDFSIIINTVPHLVIDRDVLIKVNKSCLVIDLASKPGGVDFDYARRIGINTIWSLSLPGKVAPQTSGLYIKRTLYNCLKEMEA